MNRALVAAIAAAGILAGILAAVVTTRDRGAAPALEQATRFDAPRPLPEFSLVDASGAPFGPARLHGRWTFLFFGFLNCPDVCPTTLATLAAARRSLAGLPADEVPAVAFVSVDPGRDTPELLGRYVAAFDPTFIGATGTREAIDRLAAALGIAVIIGAPAADGSYSVDHSAGVYLVDPESRIVALFGAPHDAEAIARDYRRIVDAG